MAAQSNHFPVPTFYITFLIPIVLTGYPRSHISTLAPPKKRQIKSVSKMVVNLCQLNLFHLWLLYIYYIHGFGRRSFQKHPVLASWQGHRNSSSLRLEILLELQDVYADSKCRWAIPWQNTANLKHNGPVEILDLPLSQILIFQFANSWFTGFTG